MNPHESRCLGWHCPQNKECALYVKARRPNEQVFQAWPAGELCNYFQEIRRGYGEGAEPND